MLGIIVFLGIKVVSRIGKRSLAILFDKYVSLPCLAPFTLLIVLLSILSIFVGIIKSAISPINLPICIIEKDNVKHLLKSSILKNDVAQYCHSNITCQAGPCPLRQAFCSNNQSTTISCQDLDRVYLLNGIPGLGNSQLMNNLRSSHMKAGEVSPGVVGECRSSTAIELFKAIFR